MKLNDFMKDAKENRGYPEDYFVFESQISEETDYRNNCIVIKVEQIEYPIDKQIIVDCFIKTNAQYVALCDDRELFIYDRDGEGVDGVYDFDVLPDLLEEDMHVEEANIRYFADQIRFIRNRFCGEGSSTLIQDSVIIAAYLYRNNALENFTDCNDPTGEISNAIDALNKEQPGVLTSDCTSQVSEIHNIVTMLSSVNFEPSTKLAWELCQQIVDRRAQGITKDVLDFSSSLFNEGRILCFSGNPVVPAIVNDRTMDVVSPIASSAAPYRYLAGSENVLIDDQDICPSENPNILAFPCIGGYYPSDDASINRRSMFTDEAALNQALDNMVDGGRTVILMPGSFLFSHRYEALRERIVNDFGLAALIELKHPFAGSAVSGYVVVVDKEKHDEVLISEGDLDSDKARTISKYLTGGSDAASVRSCGCELVSADKFDNETYCFRIQPEIEDLDGITLSDCAELFTGVNVPSSEYYADGSYAGVPYLRVSNIKDGELEFSNSKHVSPDNVHVVPNKGDIILSVQGVVGKCAAVNDEKFAFSKQTVLIRPKAFVSTETLIHALTSDQSQRQMKVLSDGGNIPSLSVSKLKNVKLIL